MTQPNDTTNLETALAAEITTDAVNLPFVAAIAQQAVLPRKLEEGVYAIYSAGGIEVVETEGYRAQREQAWREKYASGPRTIERGVTVLDVDSFIDYLARNTDGADGVDVEYEHDAGSLELWADIDARTIKAYLDGIDGWRKHSATLQLKVSREWGEWAAIDGKLFDQVTFAGFIEDHLSTIGAPDGAVLLDICQTLQVHTSAAFKQQSILANGQRVFRYEEEVDAKAGQKGDLSIPGELTLVLRPFQGSAPVAVTARFRFQVREGVLKLGVKLAEPDKVLEDAFNGIVADVQVQVPVHVNHGRG